MALEFKDGHITGSSGVAKAGLTLGIIGTALGAMNNGGWGNGLFGGLLGGNNRAEAEQSTIAALESKIAKLEANRYTDYVGIDLYKNIVATAKEEDAKIAKVQSDMIGYVIDLDKRTALNEQASRLNREYDTAARDYMFTILNNKIDCCCEKAAMQVEFNRQLGALADSSIVSWVQSNYLPGTLKLPVTSICPQPTTTTA
jgi:hypothetical protein